MGSIKLILWLGIPTVIGLIILNLMGFVFIRENSMPRGIYRKVSDPPERGDMVLILLPYKWSQLGLSRNYVRPNFDGSRERPTLKYYIAGERDTVAISPDGIEVNGKLLEFSTQMENDTDGREMPRLDLKAQILKKGQFLVLSHRLKNGYDSRYYGILDSENLMCKVQSVYLIDAK
jgi:conjugative transfer signal peptidase TraF